MIKKTLHFQFHSFWMVGSGRGSGAVLDMITHRDVDGLPCLPGRSVKGLLRDAVYRAEQWGYLTPDTAKQWLGTPTYQEQALELNDQISPLETEPGCIYVSDATLEQELGDYLRYQVREQKNDIGQLIQHFFKPLYSTAIESGVAKDQSLRSIEVVIPLDLYAELTLSGDWEFEKISQLEKCLPLIQTAGSYCNRGLGRVSVTLKELITTESE